MKKISGILRIFCYVIFVLFAVFISVLKSAFVWYKEKFDIPFETLLYTLVSPVKGADTSFLEPILPVLLNKGISALLLAMIFVLADIIVFRQISVNVEIKFFQRRNHFLNLNIWKILVFIVLSIFLISSFMTLREIDNHIGFSKYLGRKIQSTNIYEKHYVAPDSVQISLREKKPKNIIYIYMESMETTFASKDEGGTLEKNHLPNLVELSKRNVSFSTNSFPLGSMHNVTGSGWTMGALFTTSTGVPFAFPVEGNSMDTRTSFASGITALGDILRDKGYTQEFLCGSDGNFAGRKDFFEQHGNYEVFDYYRAIEKGYISKDYRVWWGFEDEILYKIAKDEALRLASEDEPFNLTLLTVDTHHLDGYVCGLCENNFDTQVENVVYCADKQLGEFVKWCESQDFFKDTVIVIAGDHPRMDNRLVEEIPYFDRTVYNCFINVDFPSAPAKTNRLCTNLDMLPTVLYAAGFNIQGDRLGLGTNLFNARKTLTEELGFDYVNNELSKYSAFYIKHFS